MKTFFTSVLIVLIGTSASKAQTATITADFNKWEEYPLVKKIGIYETPLVTRDWLQRDMSKLAELETRCFRYELAWGKDLYTSRDITGSASDIKYSWGNANFLFNKAIQHTPAIVFCHGYMPLPLQSGSGSLAWQAPPTDYNLWKEVNQKAAENWKARGYSNRYIEIWNEPDLPGGFFSGTVDDYVKIYQYAAMGAKAGDADAKVGGPGGALQWWHDPLVTHCLNNNIPLDFLSGHAYGTDFTWQLNAMRSAINRLGNRQAEMLMTEYSPYPAAEYAANGPVERAEAAMTFFQALPTMLEYTDLSYVTWAQYIDPEAGTSGKAFDDWDKLGLIDGNYGFRKALFNAFKLYGMMPADRCEVKTPTTALGSMASTSDDCSALVIWNTTESTNTIRAILRNVPVQEGVLQVYQIDQTINSWYETGDDRLAPTINEETTRNEYGHLVVSDLTLRPKGVLFIRFQAKDAKPLFPKNDFAKIIRTDQWFETTRDNTNPYAYFDSKTWTARLSTCNKANGTAMVSVTAENLPEDIRVTTKSDAISNRNSSSAQAVRIDFQSTSGKFTKSILFHGGIYHEDNPPQLPWGTKSAPSKVVKVDDIKDFSFRLTDYVPSNYNGRAIITFILAQTGVNSKCNFQLKRQNAFLIDNVRAENVQPSSMDLSIKTEGNADQVVKVGFMNYVDADPLTKKAKVAEAQMDGNFFKMKLTGLQANKAHHIRGLAIMASGDTIFTPEAIVHTPARSCKLTLKEVTCDQEALTAKFVGDITTSPSTVYKRGFVWSKKEDNEMPNFANNVIYAASVGNGSYTGRLSDLSQKTEYAVRAFAFSRAGVDFSEPKFFSTDPDATDIMALIDDNPIPTAIYDLSGRKVEKTSKGIFVIRYSNGTVQKVIIP